MGGLFVGGLLACLLLVLLADSGLSQSKGSAKISVLMPKHVFFARRFKSALYRSIYEVSRNRKYKKLTTWYQLGGTIDFAGYGQQQVTKAFCDRLVKSHPSTLLYMPYDKTADIKKLVIKKASAQRIPLLLWDRTGTSSVKWKGSSGLVLHMLPTVEQMAQAGAALTKNFGWTNLAVIYDNSSGADEFVAELKRKSVRVLCHKTDDDEKNIIRALLRIRAAKTQAVFLYLGKRSRAESIFKTASTARMTGKSTAWILSNLAVPKATKTADAYPVGAMGLEVTKTFEDTPEAIKTAVKIWARGLRYYLRLGDSRGIFMSNGTCTKPRPFRTGVSLEREMRVHGRLDANDRIRFTEEGTSNEKIRITNLNSKREWVKIGDWSSAAGLEMFSVTGPGGVKLPACPRN